MYSAWWKVSLKNIKDTANVKKDAKVTIKNIGAKTLHLKAGQSLDCPSSGLTRRDYDLAPNDSIVDTIPQSMLLNVQPDEIYFGLENVESKISIRVDTIAQPVDPIIPGPAGMVAVAPHVDPEDTVKTGVPAATAMQGFTIDPGTTLYKFSVKDLNAFSKYEPEFTYRNDNATPAKVTVKMAFERPAYGTTNTSYEIEPGMEEVVVYKKNMLDGLEGVDSIYLLTTVDQPITFLARYKHVREGKACKTNIDFNWKDGHTQEGRTTQWYAIDVAAAKANVQDIVVYLLNQGNTSATVKASMAFDCPYIDLQEVTRSISKNDTVSRRMGYSTYAMMSDTIWIGLETNQDLRFWATTQDAETKENVDSLCLKAITFDWDKGVQQEANDTVWYLLQMDSVRKLSKFPTVVVENMSNTADAVITAEMSLECPDSIENEQQSITIKAADTYSRKITRTMFENIKQDEIYLRVVSTQKISLKIRMNEEAEGTTCGSAIPFNWVSGNSQAANANLWYKVDLRDVMGSKDDLRLKIENKDAGQCKGVGQLTFGCPDEEAPSTQSFTLNGKQTKTLFREHSSLQLLPDSVIYINLQGNTAMRISAERVAPAPFTTITGEGLIFDTLHLDTKLYTDQAADTAWYIIPAEDLAALRTLNENDALTPKIFLSNTGTADYDVTIEAAFAFPITEKMMSQKVTVPAGQEINHALDYKLFSQVLSKFNSIVVRVAIPAEAVNKIRFRSEYAKAYGGNRKEAAIPILLDNQYTQSPGTEIWYKIKTADWKKKDLFGKSLNIATKNAGKGNAKINMVVNDGILSNEDMLMERGERSIKKGESRSHNIPAEAIYGLGDVELYIKIKTTDSLVISTSFGSYAKAAADTNQQKAKLVVPNVMYELPADTTMWFQLCMPYLHYVNSKGQKISNFIYTDSSALAYELAGEGPAKVTITSTFQDTLLYKLPVRTRTVNKSGTERKGRRLLSDLLSEAISRYGEGQSFDITSFQDTYIDSMLHRFVTRDSVTLYYRVRSNKAMKFCLYMQQKTGNACLNAVEFDWEHGYVNPADSTKYIHVKLDKNRVPEGKDLKLHIDNWTDQPTDVEATLYIEDCAGDDLGTVKKKIVSDTSKVLQREFLDQQLGWSGLMIKYYSDTTTHIWAELVDPIKRDTLYDTLRMYVCKGYSFIDLSDTTRTINKDTVFNAYHDSINKEEAKYYICETHYDVKLLKNPSLPKIDQLNPKPVIAIGSALDVTGATADIYARLKSAKDSTIADVDTITWEYSLNGSSFTALTDPAPVLNKTSIALRYTVVTECGATLQSTTYKHAGYASIDSTACGPITWLGKEHGKVGKDTIIDTIPATAALDSIVTLYLTINPDTAATEYATVCEFPYTWNNRKYNAAGVYDTILLGGTCYTYYQLDLKEIKPIYKKETIERCNDYTLNGVTYKDSAIVNDTIQTDYLCDSIITTYYINIKIPTIDTLSIISKYGDRLLMINRNEINLMDGWDLDIDADVNQVRWYMEDTPKDTCINTGYYLTNPDGSQNGKFIKPGRTYYAVIEQPAEKEGECPRKAETKHYTIGKAAAAPALVPSLARPGEDVRVINLNPEETTTIRIYTTEGLIQGTYTVRGEESFTIQAAQEHGFYLVELRAESIKSTLRYIVK